MGKAIGGGSVGKTMMVRVLTTNRKVGRNDGAE